MELSVLTIKIHKENILNLPQQFTCYSINAVSVTNLEWEHINSTVLIVDATVVNTSMSACLPRTIFSDLLEIGWQKPEV